MICTVNYVIVTCTIGYVDPCKNKLLLTYQIGIVKQKVTSLKNLQKICYVYKYMYTS